MSVLCPQCGAPINDGVTTCEYCGASIAPAAPIARPAYQAQPQQVVYAQNVVQNGRANWPIKNKIVAGILALLLGGLGVHKFYLGQTGKGILYLLFCWTYVPALLSFIEGLIILCSNDENFQIKYKCRLG